MDQSGPGSTERHLYGLGRTGAETSLRLALVAEWIDGKLDPDSAERVAATVQDDPERARDAEWIRRLIRAAADHPLIAPPPLLRQRLRQGFRRWAFADANPGSEVIELPTVLIFDSRRDHLQLAVRGGGADQARHFVFRCDLADLVVDARWADTDRLRLSGQVLLGQTTSSPVFEMVASGPGVLVTSVDGDASGCFSADVPDTVDRLVVSNGEMKIVATLPPREP